MQIEKDVLAANMQGTDILRKRVGGVNFLIYRLLLRGVQPPHLFKIR